MSIPSKHAPGLAWLSKCGPGPGGSANASSLLLPQVNRVRMTSQASGWRPGCTRLCPPSTRTSSLEKIHFLLSVEHPLPGDSWSGAEAPALLPADSGEPDALCCATGLQIGPHAQEVCPQLGRFCGLRCKPLIPQRGMGNRHWGHDGPPPINSGHQNHGPSRWVVPPNPDMCPGRSLAGRAVYHGTSQR